MDKLKKQILRRSVLLGVLMGLLMLLIVVPPLYHELSNQSQQNLTHILKNRALLVEQTLFQMQEIARQITSRSMIRNRLMAYNAGEISLDRLQRYTAPLLQDALDKARYARAVRRLDAQGEVVVEVGTRPLPVDVRPDGDKLLMYGPFKQGDKKEVIVSAPIHSPEGAVVGWDQVLFLLDPLQAVVGNHAELFDSGEVVLARRSEGGLKPFFAFRHQEKAPPLAALPPGRAGHFEAGAWSYAFSALSAEDWVMIVRVPKAELDGLIRTNVLRIVAAALLLTLLVIPAASWLMTPLLKRLEAEFRIRHEAEDALKELNSNLERAIEEEIARRRQHEHLLIHQARLAQMGEMIGAIAHQWRQPLNALALTVQDVKDAKKHDELDDEYIEENTAKAMRLINHMSKTIDDFRGFFRLDRHKRLFDPAQLIGEAVEFFRGQFAHSHISTALDLPKEPLEIAGYPTEFKQVLLNLIANARDAIRDHEPPLEEPRRTIAIKLESQQNVLLITISDHAGGIPAEVMERIFDPYFTTKEEGKGVGLGLYMSKLIVEDHMNGQIRAENSEKGACFIVELPFNSEGSTQT
jgi:signal transduction histidine kinase